MAERTEAADGGPAERLAAGLARVELLVLDVDGVLTDGRIVYGPGGTADEIMHFHVHDGLALRWLKREGLVLAWITGRGSPATRARAEELEIDVLVERVPHKGEALRELQERRGIAPARTLVVGDDLPDLSMRAHCGLFAAPANACADVQHHADLVTVAHGGHGAVRELAERLLRARGRWQALVEAALR